MKLTFLSAVALAAATCSAVAQEQTTLRLAHWLPATHPVQTTGIEPWVKSIEEASEGRIKIQIFPGQQLGAAPDHYDMVRDGVADISYVNPGYNAGRFPIFELTGVPFETNSGPKAGKAIHKWYQGAYSDAEMGDIHLCLVNPHEPGRFHTQKAINVPDDVKGLSVRPAHATMARYVEILGGSSVQVPAPEAREALARGVADAITLPYVEIMAFGIDKITKYHTDLPFYVSAQILMLNPAMYDGLSEEDRKVIDAHCTPDWSQKFSQGWADLDVGAREKIMSDSEHEVYSPSAEEERLWRESAQPVIAAWEKDAGASGFDPAEILAGYRDALEANDAKY